MVALNFFPLAGAISLPLLKDFLRSDVGADNLAPRDLSSTDTNAGLGDGYLTRVETLPNDDGVLTTVISITS